MSLESHTDNILKSITEFDKLYTKSQGFYTVGSNFFKLYQYRKTLQSDAQFEDFEDIKKKFLSTYVEPEKINIDLNKVNIYKKTLILFTTLTCQEDITDLQNKIEKLYKNMVDIHPVDFQSTLIEEIHNKTHTRLYAEKSIFEEKVRTSYDELSNKTIGLTMPYGFTFDKQVTKVIEKRRTEVDKYLKYFNSKIYDFIKFLETFDKLNTSNDIIEDILLMHTEINTDQDVLDICSKIQELHNTEEYLKINKIKKRAEEDFQRKQYISSNENKKHLDKQYEFLEDIQTLNKIGITNLNFSNMITQPLNAFEQNQRAAFNQYNRILNETFDIEHDLFPIDFKEKSFDINLHVKSLKKLSDEKVNKKIQYNNDLKTAADKQFKVCVNTSTTIGNLVSDLISEIKEMKKEYAEFKNVKLENRNVFFKSYVFIT